MKAWVVGASGAWGGAVARELLGRGCDVAALGRRDVPELSAEASRRGRAWSFVPFDIGKLDGPGVKGVVARLAEPGPPDVLVICSAVTGLDRETMTRANFLVPAALVEAGCARMRERGSGRIGVFMAQNARLGLGGLGDFSAGQGALWTWCEALQRELSAGASPVTLTRVVPPRTASGTQRWVSKISGHSAKLHEPNAGGLVEAILAGKRRAGRRPWLAALATAFR
jgi:NAD(P)-dependent dehydrogenase (short-subunit alcohol dehydrogenase family)